MKIFVSSSFHLSPSVAMFSILIQFQVKSSFVATDTPDKRGEVGGRALKRTHPFSPILPCSLHMRYHNLAVCPQQINPSPNQHYILSLSWWDMCWHSAQCVHTIWTENKPKMVTLPCMHTMGPRVTKDGPSFLPSKGVPDRSWKSLFSLIFNPPVNPHDLTPACAPQGPKWPIFTAFFPFGALKLATNTCS